MFLFEDEILSHLEDPVDRFFHKTFIIVLLKRYANYQRESTYHVLDAFLGFPKKVLLRSSLIWLWDIYPSRGVSLMDLLESFLIGEFEIYSEGNSYIMRYHLGNIPNWKEMIIKRHDWETFIF